MKRIAIASKTLTLCMIVSGLMAAPTQAQQRLLNWPGKNGGNTPTQSAPVPSAPAPHYRPANPAPYHSYAPVTETVTQTRSMSSAPVTYDYHPVDVNGVKPYVPVRSSTKTSSRVENAPIEHAPVVTSTARPYQPPISAPVHVAAPAPIPVPVPNHATISVTPTSVPSSASVQYDAPPKAPQTKAKPPEAQAPMPAPKPVIAPKPVPSVSTVTRETAPVSPPEDAPYEVPATSKYASRIKAAREAHNQEAHNQEAQGKTSSAPATAPVATAPEMDAPLSEEQTDHVFIPGEQITNPQTQSPRVYSLHRAYGMQPDAIPVPQSDNDALLETHFDAEDAPSDSDKKDE